MEYSESTELSENVVSSVQSIGDIASTIVLGSILLFITALVLAFAIAGIKAIITTLIDEWDYL